MNFLSFSIPRPISRSGARQDRLGRGLLAGCFLLASACGSAAEGADPAAPGSSSGGSGSGREEAGAPGSSGGAGAPAPLDPPSGAQLTLSLRGSTAPVAHADGHAGQTPDRQIVAVTSLWLYKDANDPDPLKVIDRGTQAVEADLVTGTTSDIGTVVMGSLTAGTYTLAKVGAAYVRYRVAARMHAGVAVDGHYDNVQALSDGAVIDGQTRAKGWYRYAFAVGATTYGTLEGAGAPLPHSPSSGGLRLDTSGPEAFYVFPTLVRIDPAETRDQRVVCEVNVHESFRWKDQPQPGYAAEVFDTTPSTFEPIMSFGASALALFVEAK